MNLKTRHKHIIYGYAMVRIHLIWEYVDGNLRSREYENKEKNRKRIEGLASIFFYCLSIESILSLWIVL